MHLESLIAVFWAVIWDSDLTLSFLLSLTLGFSYLLLCVYCLTLLCVLGSCSQGLHSWQLTSCKLTQELLFPSVTGICIIV